MRHRHRSAASPKARADRPPGGGRGGHHGPLPPNALFDALDTNHDGILSADEMANASTALKALLKNGSTELRREDLRPAPPEGRPAVEHQERVADENGEHPRPAGVRAHQPPPLPPDEPAAPERREGRPEPAPAPPDAVRGPREAGPGERQHRHGPPPSPLFDALDANHDGVLSAAEMAAAPASLRGLLKGGATQLRRGDLRPTHPPQAEHAQED